MQTEGSFSFHLEQQQQTLENHSKPFIDEQEALLSITGMLEASSNVFLHFTKQKFFKNFFLNLIYNNVVMRDAVFFLSLLLKRISATTFKIAQCVKIRQKVLF